MTHHVIKKEHIFNSFREVVLEIWRINEALWSRKGKFHYHISGHRFPHLDKPKNLPGSGVFGSQVV